MGMTKKPDEIKNGLECCIKSTCEPCCPYGNAANCKFAIHLLEDALAYIQQLEAQNTEKDARIRQLEEKTRSDVEMLHRLGVECLSVEKVATRLYNDNDALRERITQLEAERDALTKDLETFIVVCDCCKNADKSTEERPCNHCKHIFKGRKSCFEWRGVQKEE